MITISMCSPSFPIKKASFFRSPDDEVIRWRTTCPWIAPVALVEAPCSDTGFEGKGVPMRWVPMFHDWKIWAFGARLFFFKICSTGFRCDTPENNCHCEPLLCRNIDAHHWCVCVCFVRLSYAYLCPKRAHTHTHLHRLSHWLLQHLQRLQFSSCPGCSVLVVYYWMCICIFIYIYILYISGGLVLKIWVAPYQKGSKKFRMNPNNHN